MPQITLEYTDNVKETNFKPLLVQIHHILSENLPTELQSCKSRFIKHELFCIGNDDKNNGFVHLSISVLKGRNMALREAIGNLILKKLENFFENSLKSMNLQITVAISELPDVYLKYKQST